MNHQYLQYRAADVLSKALPRPFAYWIGLRVADALYRRDERGRKAVMANLDHILKFKGVRASEETLERMARQTFRHFGKYVVDFFRFTHLTKGQVDRMISIQHPEHIDEAVAAGKGVLAVTAHFGSWEMAGLVMSALGHPVNVVVLEHTDQRINRLFQSRRERRGFKVIPLGKAARGTVRALRNKEIIAMLADRDYSGKARAAMFFGAPARFPRGPAELCVRMGASVMPAFLIRQPDDSFLFRVHEPIVPGDGVTDAEIQGRICAVLQEEISGNPTQWYMFEEFWNGENGRRTDRMTG